MIENVNNGSQRKVFLNRGDGTFVESDQPTAANDYLVGSGDFNGDGKIDLVVWNYYNQTLSLDLGNGSGGFPTVEPDLRPAVSTPFMSPISTATAEQRPGRVAVWLDLNGVASPE